jgi:hypothetical protein
MTPEVSQLDHREQCLWDALEPVSQMSTRSGTLKLLSKLYKTFSSSLILTNKLASLPF